MINNSVNQQWVCLQCGFNMIGELLDICPFCGASHEHFMPWDEVEKTFRVTSHPINNYVEQLLSAPKLGLEHAAYKIETETGDSVWIDSPSAFNRNLTPVKSILFTHHHFLGASNQYQRLWNSQIWLHELDAKHQLAALFDIDRRFTQNFQIFGIEAYHIGGHTPGFTFYLYRDVLFVCDYVFLTNSGMVLNPFGPKQETLQQSQHIYQIVKDRALKTVCGFNYVSDFSDWLSKFESLIT
jgi:hydroxyacylglutathione hydrolase